MKFKFPLQKVLEHRKIIEDLAQKDFLDAVSVMNREHDHLTLRNQAMRSAHERAGSLVAGGGYQGPALTQIHEFIQGQKVRIAQQEKIVQQAEKLVESKREVLRQAAQEYKIMEKMRENKFDAYKADRLTREQLEMDEQSFLRFKAVKES